MVISARVLLNYLPMTQGGHVFYCIERPTRSFPWAYTLALCLEHRVLPWNSETSRRGPNLYEHVSSKLDLVRTQPQGSCAACETVKVFFFFAS